MPKPKEKKPPTANGRCPDCRAVLEVAEGKPPTATVGVKYHACPKCPYFWRES